MFSLTTPVCVLFPDVGLEKLHSGAVLLTLELPSAVHDQANDTVLEAKQDTASARYTQDMLASEKRSAESPVTDFRISATRGTARDSAEALGYLSGGRCSLTEAAMIQSVALTLVEAADVLVIPLLDEGVVSTSQSHNSRAGHEFGELLCMGSTSGRKEGSPPITLATSQTTDKSLRTEPKPVNAQVRLPDDVLQLLQAMRQLINEEILDKGANRSTRQSRIYPTTSAGPLSRHRRLPLVIIALEVIPKSGQFELHPHSG